MSITHIFLVIDESGSMGGIARQAHQTAEGWAAAMTDENTSFNLAYFAYKTRWVDRGRVGGVAGVQPLRPGGGTALRDAFLEAVQAAQLQLNGDPDASALVLVVTDGEENSSRATPADLHRAISHIRGSGRADLALMVPPGQRESARRIMGLNTEDVREWEATTRGLAEANELVTRSVASYKSARAAGVRSVGRFFVDVGGATAATVQSAGATPLSTTRIREFPVHARARIDEFATSRTGNYVVGEWYYQLTKPETIQPHKKLLLDDGGKWYEGEAVRQVLGLDAAAGDVRVAPVGLSAGRRLFVQSTSTNRNLIPGQSAVRLT